MGIANVKSPIGLWSPILRPWDVPLGGFNWEVKGTILQLKCNEWDDKLTSSRQKQAHFPIELETARNDSPPAGH